MSSHYGTSQGGSLIQLDGTGFDHATSVQFGSTPAISFAVMSDTQIEVTSPPGKGSVDVTVVSADGSSATSAADRFNYTNQLGVATTALPKATVGVAYSFQLKASGGVAPYHWSLTSGKLPSGMSFSSAGQLKGTPTAKGTFGLGFKVTDSETPPGSVTASLTLTVQAVRLRIETSSLPSATAGLAYVTQLKASGGATPYRWKLTSGRLAPGLSLSPAGRLAGEAVAAGTFYFGVRVTDAEKPAETALRDFALVVRPNNGPGYWLATLNGVVSGFGSALPHGSVTRPSGQVVGIAALAPGRRGIASAGYFVATTNGSVYAFGNAKVVGHPRRVATPVVAIAAAPKGDGYLLVTRGGMVYAYGTQGAHGHLKARPKSPIAAVSVAPSGRGYWLVAANGRVYRFGAVRLYGSPRRLSGRAVAIVADAAGTGYWIATTTGTVYAFGSAKFHGDEHRTLPSPIAGMAIAPSGAGYWLVGSNGTVYGFGSAKVIGSASRPASRVVGIASA